MIPYEVFQKRWIAQVFPVNNYRFKINGQDQNIINKNDLFTKSESERG